MEAAEGRVVANQIARRLDAPRQTTRVPVAPASIAVNRSTETATQCCLRGLTGKPRDGCWRHECRAVDGRLSRNHIGQLREKLLLQHALELQRIAARTMSYAIKPQR